MIDTIPGSPLALQLRPCSKLVLKDEFAIVEVLFHDHKLAVIDVS